MRYQEAYELIDIAVAEGKIAYPISPSLKEIFFDQILEETALRVVKKRDSESFSTSGKSYIFTNANITEQFYKVELDKTDVPFVPESSIISNVSDDDVSKIGYYLKTDTSERGVITGLATGSSSSPVTDPSHGLEVGDYVIISEVKGVDNTTTKVNAVNGLRFEVTYTYDANTFTIPANTASGFSSYVSGGVWELDNKQIHLTKNPDSGGTLKVFYYAKPEPKNNISSRIDLPNQLIPSAIHRTIAHFLDLGGQLQMGSGHRGLAEKLELTYVETSRAKEPMPHIIPNPMQSFVTTRNGSIGNLTGADD